MPDVVRSERGSDPGGSADELVEIVRQAASALTMMREAEGERMAAVLSERIGIVEETLERIAAEANRYSDDLTIRVFYERSRLDEDRYLRLERRIKAANGGGTGVDRRKLKRVLESKGSQFFNRDELAALDRYLAAYGQGLDLNAADLGASVVAGRSGAPSASKAATLSKGFEVPSACSS